MTAGRLSSPGSTEQAAADLGGLSCYTAALHAYLARETAHASRLLATSVRLAVKQTPESGVLAFSHHWPPLDELPDGSHLRYAASGSQRQAATAIREEIDRYGSAIVVVDSALLPWSVQSGRASAPHWVVVVGHAPGRWLIVDPFCAEIPGYGLQRPFTGWMGDDALRAAMRGSGRWSPHQRLRNNLVFGSWTPFPVNGDHVWLSRIGESRTERRQVDADWVTGRRAALALIAARFEESTHSLLELMDDIWAVAGHHAFACRWRLDAGEVDSAGRDELVADLARWTALPRILRIAAESAERGRPRPSLVSRAFDELSAQDPLASTNGDRPVLRKTTPRRGCSTAPAPWPGPGPPARGGMPNPSSTPN